MRGRRRPTTIIPLERHGSTQAHSWILAAVALCWVACLGDSTDPTVRLEDLSAPDTNTAVVVFDRTMMTSSLQYESSREYVFSVRTDRTPHTLLAEHVVGFDTTHVGFVIAELYEIGPVATDGNLVRFFWSDVEGRLWEPEMPCTLDVTSAYVFGTPSTQAVQTSCLVRSPSGESVTALVKATRFATLGG
ncbi:MAG: hypothetical protein OER90_00950 [Gemmatimonadota bacterium]|nr:hypothetical protein [Gemmatimonadota bacterium]